MGAAYDFAGNILFVKIDGELDHHVADGLRESVDRTFEDKKMRNIVFDFSRVTMMDSSGIGFVMGRYNKTDEVGGKTLLMGSNPYVTKIFDMAGIFSIVHRCDGSEEAMKIIKEEVR